MSVAPVNEPNDPAAARDITIAALAALQNANPSAQALLVSRCRDGFNKQPQGKHSLLLLADARRGVMK